MGVIDYAGGGAVHALSGVAAFIGAAALGPRIGRFDANGKPCEIKPHNASMMAFGLFVLWFGFIPFNAGSGVSVLGWMVSPVSSLEQWTANASRHRVLSDSSSPRLLRRLARRRALP